MYDPLLCTCGHGCLWIICPSCLLATMHLQRKAVWGLSVCWGRSHWEPSIIELAWNPAPAGGLACRMGQILLGGVLLYKTSVFFMAVTILSTLVDLVADFSSSSHLRLFRSDNSYWNIHSQHQAAGWRGLHCCFCPRLFILQSASKPKHCFCLFTAKTQDQSRIRWVCVVQKRLIQKTVLGHLWYNQCPDWSTDTCFYFRDLFACRSVSTHKCGVKQGSHSLCTANVWGSG